MRYEVLLWKHGPSHKADVTHVVNASSIDAAIQQAMCLSRFSYVYLAWAFPEEAGMHGEGRFLVHCPAMTRPGLVFRGGQR